jgi:hypothetical protein
MFNDQRQGYRRLYTLDSHLLRSVLAVVYIPYLAVAKTLSALME